MAMTWLEVEYIRWKHCRNATLNDVAQHVDVGNWSQICILHPKVKPKPTTWCFSLILSLVGLRDLDLGLGLRFRLSPPPPPHKT